MSRNGRRQGLMADLVRRGSSSPQKNRPLAAQLLLCKGLGRFAKVRTGRPAARTGHFETEISSLSCIPFRDKL